MNPSQKQAIALAKKALHRADVYPGDHSTICLGRNAMEALQKAFPEEDVCD